MTYIPRRPPRAEYRSVRGLRHRFTCWGDPAGMPVLMLHGFLDAGPTWQFLADCLPDSWYCIAPDWRGFGDTQWPEDGYWFPDYLGDLEAMLGEFSPDEPMRVIAHSMGGNVASLYAGVRPQRLRWLVNLEGLGLPQTGPAEAPQRYAQWLDQIRGPEEPRRYPSSEKLAVVLRARNPRLSPDRARFVAKAWTRPVEGGVELCADPKHRRVHPVLYRREEALACWRRIVAPMLLVTGSESETRHWLGEQSGHEELRSVFPHARLEMIEGAGHMMHHERPEEVAALILEFAGVHG